jgi:eukaryotic-like serine/threonine-protein kinase
MKSNSDTLIGHVLDGKYRIIKRLGRGGMAEVYLAEQESLGRPVAIKLMHAFLLADEDFLNRFKREARAMAALNHPHIASVYDFDTYGQDSYYLVMEYIDGGTLKAELEQLAANDEHMPLERVVELTTQLADALAYAHGRGMVHRDIKPGNIMLDEETGKAILTDFGIVKMLGGQTAAYTMTGALIGTPAYMSPEQALGKPGDARVDIYSLGVLLFQMITGELPFAADTPLAVVMKHVNDPAPMPVDFNPDVSPDLQEVVLKALAKAPEERFQSAAEMATALRAVDLASRQETAVLPITIPPPTVSPAPLGETQTAASAELTRAIMPAAEAAAEDAAVASAALSQAAAPPAPAFAQTPVAPVSTSRPIWLYGLGLLLLLLLIGGGVGATLGWFGGAGADGEELLPVALPVDEDNSASATPTPGQTAAETAVSPEILAEAAGIATPQPTEETTSTPTLTPTATPTLTPTPDRTAEFLATCTHEAELVNHYTYNSPNFRAAWAGENFAMNWVLGNSGTCPWPADGRWVYLSGEQFSYEDEGLILGEIVAAGAEIELRTDFRAPAVPRQYQSVWQLVDGDEIAISEPITYSVSVQERVTPTPTPTATPPASPTPEQEVEELNYLFQVLSCEYITIDWRCHVRLTPFGGGGGPYTVLVFDQPGGQATEFRDGGPYNYFAIARRCAAFNANVRVIDDSQTPALTMDRHLYLDPNNYFAGGCVLP